MSLASRKAPKDSEGAVQTTGHVWDEDLSELNNPLPRWWLWCFYITIAWGVVYTIAYPAWPLVNQATAGVLGYSTRAEVAADIAAVEEANATLNAELAAVELLLEDVLVRVVQLVVHVVEHFRNAE